MEQNYLDEKPFSGSSGNYIDNNITTTTTGTIINGGNSITIGSTTITTTNNNNNSTNNNQIVMELCLVCGDRASGRHYGAISCEGCKGFFKRSIRKQLGYQCRGSMNCAVTKHHRNRCQFCRLQKCLASGMRSDSVQHERKPIIDKKDYQQQPSSSNGQNLSTNSSTVSTNSINLNSNNGSGFLYHQRPQSQQYKNEYNSFTSGNSTIVNTNNNNNNNSNTNTDNSNSLTNYQLSANLNAFTAGFNFTDLTQSLNKRALLAAAAVSSGTYQPTSLANTNNKNNNYSPPTIPQSLLINDEEDDDDDDSLDNNVITNKNGLLMGQNLLINNNSQQMKNLNNNNNNNNLSITNNRTESYLSNNINNQFKNYENLSMAGSVTTLATANLIQKHIDQNIITQSIELLEYLQKQYNDNNIKKSGTTLSPTTSSSSITPATTGQKLLNNNINNNLLKLNDSINYINNTIVKNELIIDDTELSNQPLLNNSDQDDDIIDNDIIYIDNNNDNNKNKFNIKYNLSPTETINNNNNNNNEHNNATSSSTTTSPINNIDIDISIIIDKKNIEFKLQPPNLVPSYLNSHYVCETGSRILFLSVYWLKNIKIFQKLNENIQIIILRRHWVKLFAIGLSQCSKILSIPIIIQTITNNIIQLTDNDDDYNDIDDDGQNNGKNEQNKKYNETTTTTQTTTIPGTNFIPKILHKFEENSKINKIKKLTEHITNLNEFICIMESLNIDDYEYAFIRLICSFSPDNLNCKDLNNRQIINKIQELILSNFKLYLFEKYDKLNNNINDNNNNLLQQKVDERCNKILLRLMQLSALQSDIIEELFFTNLIGHVQIENMIPLILKLGGKGI